MFVTLARIWAQAGIPVLRFDSRGMGDSEGERLAYDETAEDITAAIRAFMQAVPTLREVMLWGLCDGASAALLYASQSPYVTGIVLVNPWVAESGSSVIAYLKELPRRFAQKSFWLRVLKGDIHFFAIARNLAGAVRAAFRRGSSAAGSAAPGGEAPAVPVTGDKRPLLQRMGSSLKAFRGCVLIVLSDEDHTAATFVVATRRSRLWRKLLASPRVKQYSVRGADHIFTSDDLLGEVARETTVWVKSFAPPG
jgi:exosortase A-associated hydrolase 1